MKQVCLIVIIAENDWYGLIQNFDFPRGVFLPFQIVGEKPRRFFLKNSNWLFWIIIHHNA